MKIYYQKNKTENSIAATINLIRLLKVNVTETTIISTLKKQVNCNSLGAIVNSLNEWGISSVAVEAEIQQLISDVTFPCLAHLNNGKEVFIVITKVDNNKITYVDSENGWITESLEVFSNKWSGVLLISEVNINSGELDFSEKRRIENWNKQKYPFIIGLLLSLLMSIIFIAILKGNTPAIWYILLFTNLVGVLTSLAIIQTKYSTTGSVFCPTNEKVNCKNVINSKGAKILSWFDLTDVCIIYFGGNLLSLFLGNLASIDLEILGLISIISSLSFPFILFSLIYQKFILKKWCLLCLAVVSILFIDLIVELYFRTQDYYNNIEIFGLCIYIIGFIIISAMWFGIRSMLPLVNNLKKLELKLDTIFKTPNFIASLYSQFQKMETINYPDFIELGNSEGSLKLHVFISPTCPSCAMIYPIISRLITDNRISLKILICPNKNSGDKAFEFTRRIISFYKFNSIEKVINGLESWFHFYKNEQSGKWFQQYSQIENDEIKYNKIIQKNIQFLDDNKITLVPLFVIDNSIFPTELDLEILEESIRYKLQ